MQDFSFNTPARMIFGANVCSQMATCLAELGAVKRVFVVTDQQIKDLGLLEPALASFKDAQIEYHVDSRVEADPSDSLVLSVAKAAKDFVADLIMGFGGGSSMDCAKLVALLAHPKSSMPLEQMYGVSQAKGSRLKLVQVPTTAGTGSEATPIAIVTTGGHTKSGVVSNLIMADLAVLDPALTLGLPAKTTAETGIDAMVHALEAYTSKRLKNPYSDCLAAHALSLMHCALPEVLSQPDNLKARADMLMGSYMAGQAFANAPVAAIHALAYPLGGHFHLPHGLTNALVAPAVMRFNLSHAQSLYAELFAKLEPQLAAAMSDPKKQAQAFIELFEFHLQRSGLPLKLSDYGVKATDLQLLAKEAMKQTRLLMNNPKEVTEADAFSIYESVL